MKGVSYMGVMSIRVADDKRKLLKIFASMEAKTISSLVANLIDEYLQKRKKNMKLKSKENELEIIMKLSEQSFAIWDNNEDKIYDEL
jgi:hypothetical protein